MDTTIGALESAARHARAYLTTLEERAIPPEAGYLEVRKRFDTPFPDDGRVAEAVVEELAAGVGDALMAMSGGRFFGFVVGATLPSSLAADWLVSAWDQNSGLAAPTPGTAAVEDIAAGWLVEALHLPARTSVGFVTGGMMANFTGLAAARHHVLARAGWDVETHGLAGDDPHRGATGEGHRRRGTARDHRRRPPLSRARTGSDRGRRRPGPNAPGSAR